MLLEVIPCQSRGGCLQTVHHLAGLYLGVCTDQQMKMIRFTIKFNQLAIPFIQQALELLPEKFSQLSSDAPFAIFSDKN